MTASSKPAAVRNKAHIHPTSQSVPFISAATRVCAQEADAAMTRDDWRYHSPGSTAEHQRLVASRYFLL